MLENAVNLSLLKKVPKVKQDTPIEPEQTAISRKRKIIVLIFVIGFWIYFYWYRDSQTPPPPPNTSSEIQKEISGTNP